MGATVDDATAQHVRRTLRALELLAEGPQTQADLARHLAVHRRTARRLLARLADEGYATTVQHGRQVAFAATPRVAVLGRQVADQLDLVAIGREHLAQLDGTPTGARFIAVLGNEGVAIVHVEAGHDVSEIDGARLARSGPLHATAAGKVFLSADNGLLGEVLNHELLAFTPATLVTRADLLLELAAVRTHGYATEDGEHRAELRTVASGVYNHVGNVAVVLGATLLDGAKATEVGPIVRDVASRFSREIGGLPAPDSLAI